MTSKEKREIVPFVATAGRSHFRPSRGDFVEVKGKGKMATYLLREDLDLNASST